MSDLKQLDFYKNIKNSLLLRLCITVGITLFWTIKTLIADSYYDDESFLLVFLIFANITVAISFIVTFRFANKRKDTYCNGDVKTRLGNFLQATMYRYSAMEISPVLFMVGFVMFGKIYFVIEAIGFYSLFILYFPTAKRLTKYLKLENNNQSY
ncbi:hypothetical protein [Mangrovibacterium sp.]|uniref:hypothetical protein n=1 Tax=Mangrovibacterium sp. TaxID=1961364 RepID=UPI0035646800